MNVAFYALTGHKFDKGIEAAFAPGVRKCGDNYQKFALEAYKGTPDPHTDVAVFLGVKNNTRDVFRSYIDAGKIAIIWDKGYTRIRGGPLKTLYWRVAVNCFQPHPYLFKQHFDHSRWSALSLDIKPMSSRSKATDRILYCGGSQKYCDWHNLGDATKYAAFVLAKMAKYSSRPIAYRPKPGWEAAVSIPGAEYVTGLYGSFGKALKGTSQVVVYGSNAAFEAIINGVPATVLGDGIALPLANTSLRDLDKPRYVGEKDVRRLAAAASWCQWTMKEMEDGSAWDYLRGTVKAWQEGKYGRS